MERKTKVVFLLDNPYTQQIWPVVSPESQQIILDLLCSYLSPIGKHNAAYVVPSKGKRSKKRKRADKGAPADQMVAKLAVKTSVHQDSSSVPPPPEVSEHILIGLASITRHLQTICKERTEAESPKQADDSPKVPTRAISAVFVCREAQPGILNAHIPQLLTRSLTSTKFSSSKPATKLIQLSRGSEERLSASLGLPRLGFIAVLDGAPHSDSLINYIKANIADIDVEWLKEASEATYLPLKVNAVATPIGVAKKTQGKK